MISDKVVNVKTDSGDFQITITSDQIRQTVTRRLTSLMPKARILDMHEEGAQGDLLSKKK